MKKIILTLIIIAVLSGFSLAVSADYEDWDYKRSIHLTENSGSNLTDFQVPIDLTTALYNNTGLVGSWHFSEGSGSRAQDSSGNNNDGTLINGPVWTTGKFGTGLQFDGSNDYMQVSDSPELNPTSQITVAAWYKPTSSWVGLGSDPIVGKPFTSHSNPYYQYHLSVTGDQYSSSQKSFSFYVATTNGGFSTSVTGVWTLNNWYYVVGTYNGSAVNLYVDGQLVSSDPASGDLRTFPTDVFFGKYGNLNYYLRGITDEVSIYNRALSLSEIQERFNATKARLDFGDLRFTANPTNEVQVPHWLENDNKAWVKVPIIPANSSTDIFMYYGNSSKTYNNSQGGNNTFEFFDDFEDGTYTDKWTVISGTWSESGGVISQTDSTQANWDIQAQMSDIQDAVIETKVKWTGGSTSYGSSSIKLRDDPQLNFRYDGGVKQTELRIDAIGSLHETSFSWNSNTWYRLKLITFGNYASGYIDDVLMHNNIDLGSSSTGKARLNNYFAIGQWDDARVRKYASPEPTLTIGSEQQNVAASCTDNDADGYGAEGTNLTQCDNPTVPDCNDTNADINPEAYDIVGNGIDEDCSGSDASYNFSIETDFLYPSETSTYYVGDDIWYQVTIKRDGVLYNPAEIALNLTNHYGDLYGSHTKSDMTYVSSGVYKGYFGSTSFDNSAADDIRYDVWIYGDMNEQLDYNIHRDFDLLDGTVPSFISTAYTYLTDALSNHTVKDLVVNSTEAKIDWSESTLDLHARNIDLDSALTIGDRSAYLDSAAYNELNDSATITFYNVNCASAFVFYSETATTRTAILAENKQCLPPRCTDIQCTGSTLTVTVSSFTGYAAESDSNLSIDADDPKFAGAQVHFTADYRNVTDDSPISGATCTIYFTDGNYPMAEGASIYTYNRTFVTEGLKDYNVTCSKAGFSTLTAFDNATIVSVEIPEFSTITLGLGLIAVLAGLVVMRKKR